jgi:lipoate-protein ligase A
VFVDGAAAGTWNMAVDDVLLAAGRPALRFYFFSEPTLSLGYFQSVAARTEHATSTACELVRRASGGGAILHHTDVTYSLTLPSGHELAAGANELYRRVHAVLARVLSEMGAAVELRGCEGCSDPASRTEAPFLCFQRSAGFDLIAKGTKVGGSAQRRRQGGLLQHGSVLWRTSPYAPELVGLSELAGSALAEGEFVDRAVRAILAELGFEGRTARLSGEERAAARALVASRYGTADWNQKR